MSTPTDFDWAVRTEIYQSFAATGRAPTFGELAETFEVSREDVATSVDALFQAHEIAPLPDRTGVWMANPFSAIETAYPVETPKMTTFANCAWDALGVPAILGTDGWTRTRCAESGVPLEFGVRGGELTGDDGVIHMVVPIRDAWVDIGST